MTAIAIIIEVAWLVGAALATVEVVERPHRLICQCNADLLSRHLRARWLFVVGASDALSGVLDTSTGNKFIGAIVTAVGAYYLWRWWRHTKNDRKKLKDRVLGVVRETAAGLKIVPVPGGAS